jgi:large subunit ribosomal protein L21
MYAVLRTGGKQHRVEKGECLRVEKIDAEVGTEIKLDDVLMIGGAGEPKIGRPRVAGAVVTAKVKRQARGEKVRVFKRTVRRGFHKAIGHRQSFTELEIIGIEG